MFPGLELPDPISWLSEVHSFVLTHGFNDGIERIGWAVLFVGFLTGLARVAYYASEAEWWAIFGRLLLGVIILSNLSPIQKGTLSMWNNLYTWSSAINGENVKTDLAQGSKEVGLLLGPIIIVGGGAAMFGGRIAALAAGSGNAGVVTGVNAAKFGSGRSLGLFTRILMYGFLPVFTVYAALVFLSGLTILLGMLLLPLAGAMAVFPGGLSWWSRWFGMITSSLVNIMVLPVLFNIVILLGMLGPMDVMQTHLQKANTSVKSIFGTVDVDALADKPGRFNLDPLKTAEYLIDSSIARLQAPFDALAHVIGGWLLSLVALVMGMFIALYLMRNFDKVITGFIGGVAGGIVPSLAMGGGGGSKRSSAAIADQGSGGGAGSGAGGGGASGGGGAGGAVGAGGSAALGSGGGGSSVATMSSGGNRSARGGGGDDVVVDAEFREVKSLGSSGRSSQPSLGSGS